MPKTIALVLAYNEQQSISTTIRQIQSAGKVDHIIVVNDGSTDKTAKIAEEHGAIVLSHKTNKGKREGFITGAFKAKELGAEVLFILDADVTHFPKETFDALAKEVTVGKKLMAVAAQHESYPFDDWRKGRVTDPYAQGQRVINMKALAPLFHGDDKWVSALTENKRKWHSGKYSPAAIKEGYKWPLGYVLDRLIPKNKVSHSVGNIVTRYPYRTGSQSIGAQRYGREIAKDQLANRVGKARSILRTARKNLPVWRNLRKKWLAKKTLQKTANKLKIAR